MKLEAWQYALQRKLSERVKKTRGKKSGTKLGIEPRTF
jgi:hypothetical protein